MQYILNFFDGDGLPSHCVHMDCKDDKRAVALVELVSQNHEMELCQGERIVRARKALRQATHSSGPAALGIVNWRGSLA